MCVTHLSLYTRMQAHKRINTGINKVTNKVSNTVK